MLVSLVVLSLSVSPAPLAEPLAVALLMSGSVVALGPSTAIGYGLIDGRRDHEEEALEPCDGLLCGFDPIGDALDGAVRPIGYGVWAGSAAAGTIAAGAAGHLMARPGSAPRASRVAAFTSGSLLAAGGLVGITFGLIETQRSCLPREYGTGALEATDLERCWSQRAAHGTTAFALGGLGLMAGSATLGWAIGSGDDDPRVAPSFDDRSAGLTISGRW